MRGVRLRAIIEAEFAHVLPSGSMYAHSYYRSGETRRRSMSLVSGPSEA